MDYTPIALYWHSPAESRMCNAEEFYITQPISHCNRRSCMKGSKVSFIRPVEASISPPA